MALIPQSSFSARSQTFLNSWMKASKEKAAENLKQTLASGVSRKVEYTGVRKDGSTLESKSMPQPSQMLMTNHLASLVWFET